MVLRKYLREKPTCRALAFVRLARLATSPLVRNVHIIDVADDCAKRLMYCGTLAAAA